MIATVEIPRRKEKNMSERDLKEHLAQQIKRPITDDGLVGFDQFDQLNFATLDKDGDYITYTIIADVRRMTCEICGRGWEPTGPSMGDQMFWQIVNGYVHDTCWARYRGLIEREDFYWAICNASIAFRALVPIPNQYWPDTYSSSKKPWYEAELVHYPAKLILGWRKRVAHIEIVAQGGTKFEWATFPSVLTTSPAEDAFKEENVTKHFHPDSVLLHAWTREKVREYIKKLAEISGFNVNPAER